MADRVFRDRSDAGRIVAGRLTQLEGQPGLLVLGLPRGGLPVAYEVAAALGAPLDIFVVRKLGVPGHEELAMGAISSGEVAVLNDDVVRGLGIGPEVIHQVAEREGRELLRREQAYREGRPAPDPAGRTVILVDDGLATGASMQAAILALRDRGPDRIVVAVPAAPESTSRELQLEVDEVICATTPSPFFAVGASYWGFTQTTDEEVRDLLRAAAASKSGATSGQGRTEVAVVRAEAPRAGDRRHLPAGDPSGRAHCFRSRVADQFDVVIHVDEIRAAEPLERTARWEEGEVRRRTRSRCRSDQVGRVAFRLRRAA